MSNCFKIVSSRLLVSQVSVETCVSSCSSEIFTISKWNVLTIRRLVALCKAKVNDINCILRLFITSNQKVVRLNIPVDDSLLMHTLDSLDHLNCNMQNCLQVELSPTLLELIF